MLRLNLPALGVVALVLAACAPRTAPVVPEPVYDKFGNLEAVCESDSQRQDPNYQPPLRPLPRCEDRCKANERPTFSYVGQWPICVPRDDGDDPDPQDPQQPRSFVRG